MFPNLPLPFHLNSPPPSPIPPPPIIHIITIPWWTLIFSVFGMWQFIHSSSGRLQVQYPNFCSIYSGRIFVSFYYKYIKKYVILTVLFRKCDLGVSKNMSVIKIIYSMQNFLIKKSNEDDNHIKIIFKLFIW